MPLPAVNIITQRGIGNGIVETLAAYACQIGPQACRETYLIAIEAIREEGLGLLLVIYKFRICADSLIVYI